MVFLCSFCRHSWLFRLITSCSNLLLPFVVIAGLAAPVCPFSPSEASLRRHIEVLASTEMDGRLTGTEGERRATDYVASVFASLGLIPAGDNDTFFQQFEFTAGVSLGPANRLAFRAGEAEPSREYVVNQDWRPLAFAQAGVFAPAEVIFAGYGIVAPAVDGHGEYNSYAHLDVTNKWVFVFRYLPEGISPQLRQHLNRYASLRYKAMVARDRGARGLVVVSGPNAKVKDQLVPLAFDASLTSTSIAVLSVTNTVADQWLKPVGKTLKDLQDTLDTGGAVMGFALPQSALEATLDIRQEKRIGRNVLARLPAHDHEEKPPVIVGAHIDHLGHGIGAGSLAQGDEKGAIHYGADDNASGVAGMLEIAHALVIQQTAGTLSLQRDVLFAAWSGEELGLLGSAHFINTFEGADKESASPARDVAAYLNLDMIGRLDKALILQGIGSSSVWQGQIERNNASMGLAITVQDDSYLPTDATSFYLKGIPILNAFTGAHAEYHTPRDTIEKINYAGAEKVVRLMTAITQSLATRTEIPDYRVMEKPSGSVGRVALRAYLGTIPDYTPDNIVGVKLAGVVKGGPADQAGMQGGDLIVEVAGKKVENIYDYTYAVDALQIGIPVPLVVQRGEQRLPLTVTPGARE